MKYEPPSISQIALMKAHSLASLAQAEIQALILAGTLAPGERLGEAEMAERIGISRGPIREAFRALGEQGLVQVEKNRGVFVRQISVEEADETYAVRSALEGLAGQILAQRIDRDQVRTLKGMLVEMEAMCRAHDTAGYSDLNLRFHAEIIRLSGNQKLVDIYDRLVATLRLFRHRTLACSDTLAVSLREHRRIVKALASSDSEAASRAIVSHIEASRRRMHAIGKASGE